MNRIDFIIKNFQAANFLKDLKKEISSGWGEDEVLKNYIDFNDLEYQLNYLKLSKADIPKKVDAYLHGDLDIKKLILDFFKKKLPINKNTLNKYYRVNENDEIETIENFSLGITPNVSFRVNF